MRFRLMAGLYLYLFMLSASLQALDSTVTIEQVEELALKQNPMVLAADAAAEGAADQIYSAAAPYDPMLMLGYSGQKDSPLNLQDASMRSLMWDQRWRFPGKSLIDLSGIRSNTEKQKALAQNARREALYQARLGFWHLWEKQEIYKIRQSAEKQWKVFNSLLQSRGMAGQWLNLKIIKAQLGLAKDTNSFITAKKHLDVAKSHLRHVLGADANTKFGEAQSPKLSPYKRTSNGHHGHAFADHPAKQAAEKSLEQSGSKVTAARAAFLPDLNTRLWMDDRSIAADSYGFRVGLQIPLGLAQGAALSGAKAEKEAAQQRLNSVLNSIHHMLEEADVEAEAAWNLLELYESGLLKQSKQAWQLAKESWANEGLQLSDYIESFDIYLDIQNAFIKTKVDYGRALARLDYEKGIYQIGEKP